MLGFFALIACLFLFLAQRDLAKRLRRAEAALAQARLIAGPVKTDRPTDATAQRARDPAAPDTAAGGTPASGTAAPADTRPDTAVPAAASRAAGAGTAGIGGLDRLGAALDRASAAIASAGQRALGAGPSDEARAGAAAGAAGPGAAAPGASATGHAPPLRPAAPDAPNTPDTVTRVARWVRDNWIYAASAGALSLSGLFAAQYAAEAGLLSPGSRLALATLMGLALLAAGEAMRRRGGDGAAAASAHLPSIFAGAGLVTLYGSALVAQHLYDMIAAPAALALLAALSALAIGLGWLFGPALAATGILGATIAPFLAGGDPGHPAILQAYFGLIALTGLLINAAQRWRLISGLALFVPFLGAAIASAMPDAGTAFIALSVGLCLAAGIFAGPDKRAAWRPALPGPSLLGALAGRTRPGRGQTGLTLFWGLATVSILSAAQAAAPEALAGIVGLTVLFLAAAAWAGRGAGVVDLAVMSMAALGVLSLMESAPRYVSIDTHLGADWIHPMTWIHLSPTVFYAGVLAACMMSAAALWRSVASDGRAAQAWAYAAAIIAPSYLALQEAAFTPGDVLGAFVWANIAMILAAAATWVALASRNPSTIPEGDAEHADRTDDAGAVLRTALGALVAMAMIALSLFVMLSDAALSMALAVLVLSAAALDRRFDLASLGWFIQAGVAVLTWRVVAVPGLDWAVDAARLDLALAYVAPSVCLGVACWILRGISRPVTQAVAEGGAALAAGAGLTVVMARWGQAVTESGLQETHWTIGLVAAVWLIAALAAARGVLAQAGQGRQIAGAATWAALVVRGSTAAFSTAVAAVALYATLGPLNPIFSGGEIVLGPVGANTLALAYLVPGLVLIAGSIVLTGLPAALRRAVAWTGGGLAFVYTLLAIAHAWRGPVMAHVAMGSGELWSYTGLLVALGAALFVAALMRDDRALRYAANGFLLVAIAKVFVIDAIDLEGLARAGSFLLLGLVLAGLAWINRRAVMIRAGAP